MSTKRNRIFSYYGGKQEMAESLIGYMPKHKAYLEPFAGSLAVFFKKQKSTWNAVNDVDKDIANLYYVCSRIDLFEEFKEKSLYMIQSKEIYDIVRASIKKSKDKFKIPDIQRAVDYFFFISTSFNNRPGTSLSKIVTKWNTDLVENLKNTRKKLDNVIIENLDINNFIDKYQNTKDAFWFFDPPYYVANNTEYYGRVFNQYQHKIFKEKIDMISDKCKFLITYDDSEEIRYLFKEYYIKEVPVKYRSTHEIMDINEILITNYPLHERQQSLF